MSAIDPRDRPIASQRDDDGGRDPYCLACGHVATSDRCAECGAVLSDDRDSLYWGPNSPGPMTRWAMKSPTVIEWCGMLAAAAAIIVAHSMPGETRLRLIAAGGLVVWALLLGLRIVEWRSLRRHHLARRKVQIGQCAAWVIAVLIVVVIAAVLWNDLPIRSRFELSRTALTRTMLEARARPGDALIAGPKWIGYYRVLAVRVESGGVWFVTGADGWGEERGFVHREAPPTSGSNALTPLGDGWFAWVSYH